MARICLVEDSIDLQQLVTLELRERHVVETADTLKTAFELLLTKPFDLILLDVNLPDGSGYEACTRIKADARIKNIPIIFLTGKGDPIDKMMGFSLGADDYVVKPFEPIELRARIDARLRARPAAASSINEKSTEVGPLTFDLIKQRAHLKSDAGERDLNLTPLEFRIFYFLATHPDQAFNRSELLKAVLENQVHVKEDNIYTHICAIRRKLGVQSDLIECIPRVGYRVCLTGEAARGKRAA